MKMYHIEPFEWFGCIFLEDIRVLQTPVVIFIALDPPTGVQ